MKQIAAIWNENRDGYGGINIPDWAFVKELNRIDPYLFVTWNRAKERWVIYEKGYSTGRDHIVGRVEDEDGSYRPLDQRATNQLRKVRWLWNQGIAEFARHLEKEETALQLQQEKAMYDQAMDIGSWYALQLMGIPQFQVPKSFEEVQP